MDMVSCFAAAGWQEAFFHVRIPEALCMYVKIGAIPPAQSRVLSRFQTS
jgi:hypothetical protein